jgi:hypothetical protein
MKLKLILLILPAMIWSCNEVNDLQPVEPETVPQATIEIVRKAFPEAKDVVFKSLLNNKIWEAKFTSGTDKYTSLVDDVKMWETWREMPDSLPPFLQVVLDKTPFAGGNFSQNAEDITYYKSYDRRNVATYSFRGADYFFEWFINVTPNSPGTATFQLYKYRLNLFQEKELPSTIRKFIDSRPELKFSTAQVLVKPDYKKQFLVALEYKKGDNTRLGNLLFDEGGNLRWIDREFNRPEVYSEESNIKVMPPKIQQYLDGLTELTDFHPQTLPYDQWRGEYDGVSSYYIRLYHRGNAEFCEMYFDQDENLLFKRYFVSFQ